MSKKILIVDDEVVVVRLIKNVLESIGYKVITAYDGEEALKKAVSEQPDLIVTDIKMPKMDGYTAMVFIKQIRQAAGDLPEIPIIVCTAVHNSDVRELIEKEEVKDYIIKPVEVEELIEKINKVLAES